MAVRYTRRDFTRLALSSVPALATGTRLFAAQAPNSRIQGVWIGTSTNSFPGVPTSDFIAAIAKIGLSSIELVSGTAEALAGAPITGGQGVGGRGAAAAGPPPTLDANGLVPRCANMPMVIDPPLWAAMGADAARATVTPEQAAARQRLRDWRAATTPATWQAVRKQFSDAGIEVRTLFYSLGFQGAPTSDEDIDYAFRMAKGLGVPAITGSTTPEIGKRVAVAAAKYRVFFGVHTQDNAKDPDQYGSPESYERFLAMSPWFRIALDIGYFTAAGNDPVPFIQKHHDKITVIHLKDRKRARSLGGEVTNNAVNNYVWGQGDTPICEVLQLLKKERWDIPAIIEYDYSCRSTSDSITEVARCFAYAKRCLG